MPVHHVDMELMNVNLNWL